jgi:hypothetical protein
MKTYGHADCGVYAEVIEAGPIAIRDTVADMHHRIGAKLRPRQVVSATCGLSFPR